MLSIVVTLLQSSDCHWLGAACSTWTRDDKYLTSWTRPPLPPLAPSHLNRQRFFQNPSPINNHLTSNHTLLLLSSLIRHFYHEWRPEYSTSGCPTVEKSKHQSPLRHFRHFDAATAVINQYLHDISPSTNPFLSSLLLAAAS